jgi:hypothetical protein
MEKDDNIFDANDLITDCHKCEYCRSFDDGGGDYLDIVYNCMKENVRVTYTRNDNKPCGLLEGKYYVVKYSVNK